MCYGHVGAMSNHMHPIVVESGLQTPPRSVPGEDGYQQDLPRIYATIAISFSSSLDRGEAISHHSTSLYLPLCIPN